MAGSGSLSDPDTPIRTQHGYRCYQEGAQESLGKVGAGLSRQREQHLLRLSDRREHGMFKASFCKLLLTVIFGYK